MKSLSKAELRAQIEQQIQAFIKAGGRIQRIKRGVGGGKWRKK